MYASILETCIIQYCYHTAIVTKKTVPILDLIPLNTSLGSVACAPNFVEIGAQEHSLCTLLLFGANKKKNMKKIQRVSGTRTVSQELLGLFLSNLVCKVLYMKTLKYVDLIEIGAIVFGL